MLKEFKYMAFTTSKKLIQIILDRLKIVPTIPLNLYVTTIGKQKMAKTH